MDVSGQAAVVVGGASGLGAESSRILAKHAANIGGFFTNVMSPIKCQ